MGLRDASASKKILSVPNKGFYYPQNKADNRCTFLWERSHPTRPIGAKCIHQGTFFCRLDVEGAHSLPWVQMIHFISATIAGGSECRWCCNGIPFLQSATQLNLIWCQINTKWCQKETINETWKEQTPPESLKLYKRLQTGARLYSCKRREKPFSMFSGERDSSLWLESSPRGNNILLLLSFTSAIVDICYWISVCLNKQLFLHKSINSRVRSIILNLVKFVQNKQIIVCRSVNWRLAPIEVVVASKNWISLSKYFSTVGGGGGQWRS